MKILTLSYSTFLALTLTLSALALTAAHAQQPVSGYDYLTPEMQEMQDDDFGNPGMITVDAGEELFSGAPSTARGLKRTPSPPVSRSITEPIGKHLDTLAISDRM